MVLNDYCDKYQYPMIKYCNVFVHITQLL